MSNILAVDVGFRATGMAAFDTTGMPFDTFCSRPKPNTKKKSLRVADSDADCISRMVQDILRFIDKHHFKGMVVELPSAGAQGARANRAMGIATGMIVAIVECRGIAVEWYTPEDGKLAATGDRHAKKEKMMNAMQARYGILRPISVKADLEHIADACACYLAASTGNLVRMLH